MKQVKCKSGLTGYQCRLQENYSNFEEFEAYSETYGVATRLGYESAKKAWEANPIIQGSTNPSDLRVVLNEYNEVDFIKPEVKAVLEKFQKDKDEEKLIKRLSAIGNRLKRQFGGANKSMWFRLPEDSTGAETVRDIERDLNTQKNCYQNNRQYMLDRLESSVTEYDFKVYYS